MKNFNKLFFALVLISSSGLFAWGLVDDALNTAGNITEDAVIGAGNIVGDVVDPYNRPYYSRGYNRPYYNRYYGDSDRYNPVVGVEPFNGQYGYEGEYNDVYYTPDAGIGFDAGLYYNLALEDDEDEIDDIEDATADDDGDIVDEEDMEVEDIQ